MVKYLLLPVTIAYNFICRINKCITRAKKLYAPVISVGNITWGGSGKTPMVVETAKYVQHLGKRPVVLSRGYGRKNKKEKNIVVRDNENILADISSAGDEPYMMAQQLTCPIIVGADRYKSAELARKFNPDVFILDDGFQHWKLKRDLDIVCVNSLNPFGNGMLIPSGILREAKSALKRADLVVLTNGFLCDENKLNYLRNEITAVTGKEAAEVYVGNLYVTNMADGKEYKDLDSLKEKYSFVLITGIGSPQNFINTALNLKFKIKDKFIFNDHHKYSDSEIFDVLNNLKEDERIITTAKDAVKIKDAVDVNVQNRIYILNISVCFAAGREEFEKKIKNLFLN